MFVVLSQDRADALEIRQGRTQVVQPILEVARVGGFPARIAPRADWSRPVQSRFRVPEDLPDAYAARLGERYPVPWDRNCFSQVLTGNLRFVLR